jgi:copper(I)-binding protein
LKRLAILALGGALLALPAASHEVENGAVTVADQRVRASLGVNPNTAGYAVIRNGAARGDRLLGAACTCAREVQIHVMSTTNGVMRMAPASDGLPVPARGALTLAPGAAHLMILGLTRPVRVGERVTMTLRFQNAGAVQAHFHVVADPSSGDHAH